MFFIVLEFGRNEKNDYICNGGMFEVRQQQEAHIKRNFNDFVVLK